MSTTDTPRARNPVPEWWRGAPCPRCGADVGQRCRTSGGHTRDPSHLERRKLHPDYVRWFAGRPVQPPAPPSQQQRDHAMARAARRYLTARAVLETAGAGELLAAAVDVDAALHDMVRAAGLHCADVGCHYHDDDVPAVVDTPPL